MSRIWIWEAQGLDHSFAAIKDDWTCSVGVEVKLRTHVLVFMLNYLNCLQKKVHFAPKQNGPFL